jgi:hypothetical protein
MALYGARWMYSSSGTSDASQGLGLSFRNLTLTFALGYALLQILSICIRHWPETYTAKPRSFVLGLTAPSTLLVILACLH